MDRAMCARGAAARAVFLRGAAMLGVWAMIRRGFGARARVCTALGPWTLLPQRRGLPPTTSSIEKISHLFAHPGSRKYVPPACNPSCRLKRKRTGLTGRPPGRWQAGICYYITLRIVTVDRPPSRARAGEQPVRIAVFWAYKGQA